MKQMMVVLIATVLVSVQAHADSYQWKGKGGVVNWSEGANWVNVTTGVTGTVPGDSDTVEFWSKPTFADFTVTPPASFAGVIKSMGNASYPNDCGLKEHHLPARVKIVNANNATFTVGGTGVLEAFDGIADMLDASFASVIDIPTDAVLAPSDDFAPGASFMGTGVFRPATAAQLERREISGVRLTCEVLSRLSLAVTLRF